MRRIKQKRKDDCGIACVAMVAGVSYKKAKQKFAFNQNGSRRTQTKDLITALKRLGARTAPRLDRLPKNYQERLRQIGKIAILKSRTREDGTWHWRVYDPNKGILDPRGREYDKSSMRATSYLAVYQKP